MKKIMLLIILVLTSMQPLMADVSLKVFSKNEDMSNTSISRPRIYIQNNGTSPISDFSYHYKFKTENGASPIIQDFYTPNSSVSLQSLGNDEYAVVYDFTGVTLNPGQVLPNTSGNVIGIRHADWSAVDITNDYSNNQSESFAENTNILVYDSAGTLISGTNGNTQNIVPVADAGADAVVTDSDNSGAEIVTLDASGSYDPDGTIASYVWTFNGTAIATGQVISVNLSVGSHELVLVVTDNEGSATTDSVTINIVDSQSGGCNIEVYSRQTSPYENNISKPRIYIKNNGANPIDGFKYSYFITVDDGKSPAFEDWHTPEAGISLINEGNGLYRVDFDYSTTVLNPGQIIPHVDGNSTGIHYSDWSVYDRTDDFSFIDSQDFVKNENIPVYDTSGVKLYGNSPFDAASNTTDITIETIDLNPVNPADKSEIKIKIKNNTSTALSLADKQLYYYFTQTGKNDSVVISEYVIDGNAGSNNYLDADVKESEDGTDNAVRIAFNAGTVAPFGYAELTMTITAGGALLNESDDWSYLNSAVYTENDKVLLVTEIDMETHYGTSPSGLLLYGEYNLISYTNDTGSIVTILHDIVESEKNPEIKITDENGTEVFNSYSSQGLYINGILFESGKLYYTYLIVDGITVGGGQFSKP